MTLEYHIVVVGRTGNHPGTRVFLLGPGSKRGAINTAQDTFRKENRLATSVALMTRCVFSGSETDGHEFMARLEEKMKEKANGSTHSGPGEGQAGGTEESASAVCGSEESS